MLQRIQVNVIGKKYQLFLFFDERQRERERLSLGISIWNRTAEREIWQIELESWVSFPLGRRVVGVCLSYSRIRLGRLNSVSRYTPGVSK